MDLTWGQMAMVEYVMKNPTSHKRMVVERQLKLGKVGSDIASTAVREVLERHESLWSVISTAKNQSHKMSEVVMHQEILQNRQAEISELEAGDEEGVDSWRDMEAPIWRSIGGSIWDGAIIAFTPRALMVPQRDGTMNLILRLGHTSVDAYAFGEIARDFEDFLAARSLREPLPLSAQVAHESSEASLRMASRCRTYLEEAISSASDPYLIYAGDVDEAPYQVKVGFDFKETKAASERLGVTPAQLWLAALTTMFGEHYGGAGAIFKTQSTVRTNFSERPLVAPIARSSVVRVDFKDTDTFVNRAMVVIAAATRALRYSNYNPVDLWRAEEQREESAGGPLRGQILFNVMNVVDRYPEVPSGRLEVRSDVTLSFDQRMVVNVEVFEPADTITVSITSRSLSRRDIGPTLQEYIRNSYRTF